MDLLKKLFFDKVRTPKPGKSSLSVLVHDRNRSGVVELVGREPWIIARVENGVTKFSARRLITLFFSGPSSSGNKLREECQRRSLLATMSYYDPHQYYAMPHMPPPPMPPPPPHMPHMPAQQYMHPLPNGCGARAETRAQPSPSLINQELQIVSALVSAVTATAPDAAVHILATARLALVQLMPPEQAAAVQAAAAAQHPAHPPAQHPAQHPAPSSQQPPAGAPSAAGAPIAQPVAPPLLHPPPPLPMMGPPPMMGAPRPHPASHTYPSRGGEPKPPLPPPNPGQVFVFAHPPISPTCRTPLFPYLTFYSCFQENFSRREDNWPPRYSPRFSLL